MLSLGARVYHIGPKEWHEAVSQYVRKRALGRHEDKCIGDSVIEPCLRFHEKGGKVREIPVRHDLLEFLHAYLEVSGWRYSEPSLPLFRTVVRRTKRLTQNRLTADDMARMVKRRLREAALSERLFPAAVCLLYRAARLRHDAPPAHPVVDTEGTIQLVDSRNVRGSTACVTNVDFGDRTDYLDDPPLVMALLDRVVDSAIVQKFAGISHRKHRAEQKQKPR